MASDDGFGYHRKGVVSGSEGGQCLVQVHGYMNVGCDNVTWTEGNPTLLLKLSEHTQHRQRMRVE